MAGRAVGWNGVRGDLHQRLIDLLRASKADGAFTQESLAKAVRLHQTTVSGILHRNAGTFDLDEAAAALEHIGSSLPDFIAGVPPRALSQTERLARRLATVPADRLQWLEALLDVPQSRWPGVVVVLDAFGLLTTGKSRAATGESTPAPTPARRTTKAPKPRPTAQR